jgi:hypothetical protein
LLILLSIQCGVLHPPHVMPKLKKDEHFAYLIWTNKVFYAKVLEMFGIAKIVQDLHKKGVWKDIWLVNDHELEMIHGR